MKWSGTTPTRTRLLLPILHLEKWRCSSPSANMPWVRAVGGHSAALIYTRGRILGINPAKSPKSFPPCYSKSPLQLCLEISISSKSRNLFQFVQCITVHCKGERRKTWQKTAHPSLCLRNPYRNPQVWELSGLCPITSKKLYIHKFGFCFPPETCLQ
jgi:hypothetical protein